MALGHALGRLGVPWKLVYLLFFTVRYVDVLNREQHRLRAAMRMRAFRPRNNLHTYRTYGYLVGMILVRSLDRAERIVAAMKCRGFRGRFPGIDRPSLTAADAWLAFVAAAVLASLLVVEFL